MLELSNQSEGDFLTAGWLGWTGKNMIHFILKPNDGKMPCRKKTQDNIQYSIRNYRPPDKYLIN